MAGAMAVVPYANVVDVALARDLVDLRAVFRSRTTDPSRAEISRVVNFFMSEPPRPPAERAKEVFRLAVTDPVLWAAARRDMVALTEAKRKEEERVRLAAERRDHNNRVQATVDDIVAKRERKRSVSRALNRMTPSDVDRMADMIERRRQE